MSQTNKSFSNSSKQTNNTDLRVPLNTNLEFGSLTEYIKGDGSDLSLFSTNNINLNGSAISTTQFGYLGGLDQTLATTSNVIFNSATVESLIVDSTNTETFLVRKNGDAGDILTVDTTNSIVKLNKSLQIINDDANSTTLNSFIGFSGSWRTYWQMKNTIADYGSGVGVFHTLMDLDSSGNLSSIGNISSGGFYIEDISTRTGPGIVSVLSGVCEISTTGTGDALSLANGTTGQRLTILYKSETAGTDTAILTPTSLIGFTTITFNNIGEGCELIYTSSGWACCSINGAVLA